MAKKMSVEEILAAARAEKAKGSGGTASPPSAQSSTPTSESSTESAPVTPSPAAVATATPSGSKVPAGGKGMSMAEILAAARAGKGGAKPAVAEKAVKPAVTEKPAKAAVADKPVPKASPKPAAAKDGDGAAAVPKDTASILAAARKGTKPGPITKAEAAAKAAPSPAAKKKIEVPPIPAKPEYAKSRP